MNFKHSQLAKGRWFELDFLFQMANIGSEVYRTIDWRKKNNKKYSDEALIRCLDLIDLTVEDSKNKFRLKELLRVREFLLDYFWFDNQYHFDDEFWKKYFGSFMFAAAIKRNERREKTG